MTKPSPSRDREIQQRSDLVGFVHRATVAIEQTKTLGDGVSAAQVISKLESKLRHARTIKRARASPSP
jgi:hypothetical protein